MNKSKQKSNNFIVQGGILAIAGILVRLIGMARRIPLTNIIGDQGNGYYAAAYEIYALILLLSSYSLPIAVSKMVSSRVSKGEYKNAHRIFKASLIFAFIVGGIASILVYLFADQFAGLILEPMSAIALRVLSPALLLVAVMGVFRGYFQGLRTMLPTAISQVVEQVFLVIASLTGAVILSNYGSKVADLLRNADYEFAYGAAGGTIGCAIGAFIALAFLVFVYMLYAPRFKTRMAKDNSRFREDYRSIVKILILTIVPVILSTAVYNLTTIVNQRIFNGEMIYKGLEDLKTVHWGVFSGKYRVLINIPIALASAMSASSIPTLVGYMEKKDYSPVRGKISQVIRITMLVSIPCAVGMGVLARPIVDLLFNGEIDMAASMMQLGAITIIFYSFSTLTNGILQGINHLRIPVINALVSLMISSGFLFLILRFTDIGIFGVVLSNIVFSFLMCVLNLLAIRKYIRYKQELRHTFLIPTLSALVMGFVVFTLYKLFAIFTGNFVVTIVGIIGGIIAYFSMMIFLKGLGERELEMLPMGKKIISVLKKVHVL